MFGIYPRLILLICRKSKGSGGIHSRYCHVRGVLDAAYFCALQRVGTSEQGLGRNLQYVRRGGGSRISDLPSEIKHARTGCTY